MHQFKNSLQSALMLLPEKLCAEAKSKLLLNQEPEEIRLRAGRPPTFLYSDREVVFGSTQVSLRDIDAVIEKAAMGSAHTVRDRIKAGYLTASGGCRIGIAGTVSVHNGSISGFQTVTSLSIRIPHEIKGCAKPVISKIIKDSTFRSTLIISPPGGGKTTLLRDMIRILSDGENIPHAYRISLADERSEIAATVHGCAQMDVGCRTDIMDCCPKAAAVMMLLRSMNPEIIALDEVTASEDIAAVENAANCGVELIATIHAENISDFKHRKLYLKLLESRIFKHAVFIENNNGARQYTVKDIGGDL